MKSKKFKLLVISLAVSLCFSSCKTLKEITVDASNGEISYIYVDKKGNTFKNDIVTRGKQQYFKRDQKVTIKIENLSPQTEVEIKRNENDIWISGDSLKNPIDRNLFEQKKEIRTQADTASLEVLESTLKRLKTRKSMLEISFQQLNQSSNKEMFNLEYNLKQEKISQISEVNLNIESVQKKIQDYPLVIKYKTLVLFYNQLVEFYNLKSSEFKYITKPKKEDYINSINDYDNNYSTEISKFNNFRDSSMYFKCTKIMYDLHLLKVLSENIKFSIAQEFTPDKERTELLVKIKDKDADKPFSTSNLIIYQQARFKMFSSVGSHLLISDSKYAYQYDNRDSIIVGKKTSNLLPSLGTYLNATWSYNRALYGFGLGIGIPINIDKSTDYTPNIVAYGTVAFQTEYGRMGIIMGMGIRKVNVLAPGYSLGGKIPDASIDPPLVPKWTPGLMFGLTYNLGKRK